jgi:polo-like kinase 1
MKSESLVKKPTITTEALQDMSIPDIFVQKWVDYSAKFGIGFQLSDQSSGVHFNDSSKIIADQNSPQFTVI